VKNIISAGCLLILLWRNNTFKNRYKNKYLFLLIFNYFSFIKNVFLYYSKLSISYFQIDKKLFLSEIKLDLIKKYEHLKKHNRPSNDNDFGYYLAGLIEGDGYIGKRSIEISFHIADISLAYYIKKRIGYGNVTKYTHTNNAIRYSVWNKEGIKVILNFVNGKFFTKYKIDQIKKFKHTDKLELLPSIYERYPDDICKQKN